MGFRDPYFLYIILCNQKEVKLMANEVKGKKMGAYYAYNTSNGYKVDTRSWYKVFEHMIMNNAFTKDMQTAVKDAGIQYNHINGTVRSQKTTRRYMMENVLNLPYRSGYWSHFWVYLQKNGYIQPRDGYADSTCKDWLNRTTHFEMARGKNGYYLTSKGARKFLQAYKTAKEDKLRAEERAMAKNNETSHVINIKEL